MIEGTERGIDFWLGAGGVVVGAVVTILGQILVEWMKERNRYALARRRKAYLRRMLADPSHSWRSMQTLSAVIGASRDETARLLIEIGARGSETGNDMWAIKPLPSDTP